MEPGRITTAAGREIEPQAVSAAGELNRRQQNLLTPQVSTFVSADPGRRDGVTRGHGMISSKELSAVGQAGKPVPLKNDQPVRLVLSL
jgi:hypothetical protein